MRPSTAHFGTLPERHPTPVGHHHGHERPPDRCPAIMRPPDTLKSSRTRGTKTHGAAVGPAAAAVVGAGEPKVPFFPRCKMGAWPEPFAEADPMFLLALLTQGSEKLRRTRIMNFGVHISRAGWFAAR